MPIDFQPIEGESKIDFQPIAPSGPIQKLNPTSQDPVMKRFAEYAKTYPVGYGAEFKQLGEMANEALSRVGNAVLQFVNIPKYIAGETPVTRDTFMPKEGLKGLIKGVMQHNPIGYTPTKTLEMQPDGTLKVQQTPQQMSPVGEWIADTLARAGHEVITPDNVAIAGMAGGLPALAQKGLGIGFGVPMLKTAVEQTQQGDYQGATINAVLGALAAGSSAIPTKGEVPLQPKDIQTRATPGDLQRMAAIPPERQLPGPRGNFVAGAKGTIDFQELSPQEQQAFMAVPNEYRPPAPQTGVTPGFEVGRPIPQADVRLQQHLAQQPAPPENPGFVAGPQGIAPVNAQIGKLYDVAQPVERKMLGAPQPGPFEAGPTTLPQTLSNAEQLLKGETPELPTQRHSGVPLPGDFEKYKDLADQLKLALTNKDFDKFYDLQKEIEQVKNRSGGKPPVQPVQPRPENLRPAINMGNGKILVGEFGDAHADVLERNGINPDTIPHPDARRGFVDVSDPKSFLDRQQAQAKAGVKGTADAGGLDSQDLPGAAMARLERMVAKNEKPVESVQERNSGISLGEVGKDVKDIFENAKSGLFNRERATQLLDAADNKSKISGRQDGNRIRQGLPSKADQEALTFIAEAGGDRRKLMRYQSQVAGKDKVAESAIANALAHLDRLVPHAQALAGRLEKQRALEESRGVDTGYITNYMKHSYEVEDVGLFDTGPGGSGVSTSFLKPRSYPDYATAIADGAKPRSLNAADLLESRVAAGQKLLNRYEWAEQLKDLKTPDGPFATDLVKKGKQWTAPEGYRVVEMAPGVRMAIKNQYAKLITNVLAESMVRGTFLGDLLLATEAGLKHNMLIFDTYHMFRMMWSEASLSGRVAYKKGLSVLEYDKPTIARMSKNGDITADMAKWVEERRPTAELLVRQGLNVGRLSEALFANVSKEIKLGGININILGKATDVIQNKTFVGTFNKWIFEKMTRGAMMETALYEFDRTKANNPTWSDAQVAAHTSKQININFGNLQRQGIFKSQTARDVLQIAFLAPQWAEAMAQKEVRAGKQLAESPFKGSVGTLGKGVAVWTVAALAANQIVNMATRGHPTWDNKEQDHKLDAWIPSIGKGDGYWLSPLSSSAEYAHGYIKGAEKGDSPLRTTTKIVGNKLSPLGRSAATLASGEDYTGTKLSGSDTLKEAAKSLVPTPLPFSGVLSDTPGSTQRQAISSLGLKVDPVRSSEKLDGMSLDDRVKLVKDKKASQTATYQGRIRGVEQAASATIKRGQDIANELSRADRNWLESRNLLLSGYDNKIHYKGVDVPLSDKEQSRLGEMVKDEYTKAIASARHKYDNLPERARSVFFSEIMGHARDKARHQFMAELMSSSKIESNAPKRYNMPGLDFRPVAE